jgi:hypothetical protein
VKYHVIKAFKCKLDHRKYNTGDIYETSDPERVAFLQSKGRLGAMIEEPAEPPSNQESPAQEPAKETKHVGGGWYELPDGRRVKGKEEALAAMNGGD